jgi:hypothetical protein
MIKIALFALLTASLNFPAPATGSGALYRLAIGSSAVSCLSRDGRRVRFVSNPTLPDLGTAYTDSTGTPTIAINTRLLRNQPERLATWVVQHECSHHWLPAALNTEARADCLAMRRTVRQMGRLSQADLVAFRRAIAQSAASRGHLAGAARYRLLLRCAGGQ